MLYKSGLANTIFIHIRMYARLLILLFHWLPTLLNTHFFSRSKTRCAYCALVWPLCFWLIHSCGLLMIIFLNSDSF